MTTESMAFKTPSVKSAASRPAPMWKSWLGAIALVLPGVCYYISSLLLGETNEQYAHGYLVPLLCLFLLLKIYPNENEVESPHHPSPLQGKLWLLLGFPLVISFVPIWLVRGANSDWRLINFALFTVVFLLSLVHWYDDGGWRRIKHLLFLYYFS